MTPTKCCFYLKCKCTFQISPNILEYKLRIRKVETIFAMSAIQKTKENGHRKR